MTPLWALWLAVGISRFATGQSTTDTPLANPPSGKPYSNRAGICGTTIYMWPKASDNLGSPSLSQAIPPINTPPANPLQLTAAQSGSTEVFGQATFSNLESITTTTTINTVIKETDSAGHVVITSVPVIVLSGGIYYTAQGGSPLGPSDISNLLPATPSTNTPPANPVQLTAAQSGSTEVFGQATFSNLESITTITTITTVITEIDSAGHVVITSVPVIVLSGGRYYTAAGGSPIGPLDGDLLPCTILDICTSTPVSVQITTTITTTPPGFQTSVMSNSLWSSNTVTTISGTVFPVIYCGSSCGGEHHGIVISGLGGRPQDPPRTGCGGTGILAIFRSIFSCGTKFIFSWIKGLVPFSIGLDGTPDTDPDTNPTENPNQPKPTEASETDQSSSCSTTTASSCTTTKICEGSCITTVSCTSVATRCDAGGTTSATSTTIPTATSSLYLIFPIETATLEQIENFTDTLNSLVGPDNTDTITLQNGTLLSWAAMLTESSVMSLKENPMVCLRFPINANQ